MMLLADITGGHVLLADWLFLIGAALFVIAAIVQAPKVAAPKVQPWALTVVALGLACLGVGFLVL